MDKSPVIVTSQPDDLYVHQFGEYLQAHFPGINVRITPYWSDYIGSGRTPQHLVFSHHPRGRGGPGYTESAMGYAGHKVFVLEEGLGHSVGDLGGSLTGIIYRLQGDEFRGFTKEAHGGQTAAEVLEPYLK